MPGVRAAGGVGEGEAGGLADADARRFVFVHVGDDPDGGEIGDGVEVHVGGDALFRVNIALDDEAGGGGFESEIFQRLAGALHLLDLGGRDVPELEALAGGGDEIVGAHGDLVQGVVLHLRFGFEREQVLVLRGERLGTVDGEERLAFGDELAGEIDVELIDPAVELGVDLGDLRLVEGDLGDGMDGVRGGCVLGRAVLDTDQLLLAGGDLNVRCCWRARTSLPRRRRPGRASYRSRARCLGGRTCTRGAWGRPSRGLSSGASGARGACAPAVDYGAAEEGAGDRKNHDERFEFVHGQSSLPLSSSRRAMARCSRMISSWYISS